MSVLLFSENLYGLFNSSAKSLFEILSFLIPPSKRFWSRNLLAVETSSS